MSDSILEVNKIQKATGAALTIVSPTFTGTITGAEPTQSYVFKLTESNRGFWGDVVWKDADEIVIKCKSAQGQTAFIGAILNDGTFLTSTSDITIKYDTPGNSGHILDGITAKLNNEWFILWAYQNSGGTLAFGLTWMPSTTLKTANPTNAPELNTVNSQNIGLLYSENAHLVFFQDADEWETPLAWQNAGAVTYDGTKDKPKISSRTSTVLTLGANLENTNFTAGTTIYQVDNFKPLAVDDGLIVDAISTRGYLDIGIRFRTDGSGNIIYFHIDRYKFLLGTGGGYSVGTIQSSATVQIVSYIPPDKDGAIGYTMTEQVGVNSYSYLYSYPYYYTTTNSILSVVYYSAEYVGKGGEYIPFIKHKLGCFSYSGGNTRSISTWGYYI